MSYGQFSDNYRPLGRLELGLWTPRCGSVRVRNAGKCQFSHNFPPRGSVRVRVTRVVISGGIFSRGVSPGSCLQGCYLLESFCPGVSRCAYAVNY